MKSKALKSLCIVLVGYLAFLGVYFIFLEMGGVPGYGNRFVHVEMPSVKEEWASEGPTSVRNYASFQLRSVSDQGITEQKYEKVASIASNTGSFDADEVDVRKAIKAESALVQEEASSMHSPYRSLNLTIGVPPGHFDAMVDDLKHIGTIANLTVTKTDKTNDYLELNARRASLVKTRDALTAMKSQGGKIDELIKLEQEIAAFEEKIQGLGVQLGQFDKVNEFCTVRLTLIEIKPEGRSNPHLNNFVLAIEWAGPVYLTVLACTFVGLLVVLLVWGIAEKAGIFAALRAK